MIDQDDLGVSTGEKIDAIFAMPELYETKRLFNLVGGGRPRIFPIWLFVAMVMLNDIYRGGRTAATEMSHPREWNNIREAAARNGHHLPLKAPHRTWFLVTRKRLLTPQIQRKLDELELALNLRIAEEVGVFDTDVVALYGDGKVQQGTYSTAPGDTRTIKCVDENGESFEVTVPVKNFDPDAKVHITGDSRVVVGVKFVRLYMRIPKTHGRVPLLVAWVPDEKGQSNSEMDIAMALIRRVLEREPRITHLVYDTALHGVHRDELQRRYGVTTVAPITAKKVNKKTRERTEKGGHLTTVSFDYGNGDTQDVEVTYLGAWLCQQIITDDGTVLDERLKKLANLWRTNEDGTHRSYVQYQVPCPRGLQKPKLIRERAYNNDEDRARGFNRAENILLAPPGCDEYEGLYHGRSDAENANFMSDEQLHRERARSLGAQRQHFDLWGHSFVQAAVALHRYGHLGRRRTAA
ncbi:hypothetical protein [Iamia sp.]|uniref:hypothetical protein n=1 Tax=Iamia sp. TaxID=2722710 RepID=UPI002C75CE93|nr:hypothetical protein [Iamia sp.]HXH58993.1 hypothetical protein [Iamia sp.]